LTASLAAASSAPQTRSKAGIRPATALAAGLVCLLAACGTIGPTSQVLPASPGPSGPTGPAATGPLPPGSGVIGPPPSGPPIAAAGVAVDQSLLSFVPVGGHGLILAFDPDTTGQVAAEPALAASATGLAIAIYTRAPTGSAVLVGDDLAVVSVIRLRDPNVDDSWFRSWRDSYDEAACGNAGGVTRHAEAQIGSHTVYIGTCAGGSLTYHARIHEDEIVVSATSIGPTRVGEQVMTGLAP